VFVEYDCQKKVVAVHEVAVRGAEHGRIQRLQDGMLHISKQLRDILTANPGAYYLAPRWYFESKIVFDMKEKRVPLHAQYARTHHPSLQEFITAVQPGRDPYYLRPVADMTQEAKPQPPAPPVEPTQHLFYHRALTIN
jgi:hypothetical protein